MVSLSQAQLYTQQGRQALSQRREEFTQTEQKLKALDPKIQQTRAQMLGQNLSQKQQVRAQEGLRVKEKQKLVSELKQEKDKFEKEIGSKVEADIREVETQIKAVQSAQSQAQDWGKAESYVKKGISPVTFGGKSTSIGQKMLAIVENQNAYTEFQATRGSGGKPQIVTTSADLDDWRRKAEAGDQFYKDLLERQITTLPQADPIKKDWLQKLSDFHDKTKEAFVKPQYETPYLDYSKKLIKDKDLRSGVTFAELTGKTKDVYGKARDFLKQKEPDKPKTDTLNFLNTEPRLDEKQIDFSKIKDKIGDIKDKVGYSIDKFKPDQQKDLNFLDYQPSKPIDTGKNIFEVVPVVKDILKARDTEYETFEPSRANINRALENLNTQTYEQQQETLRQLENLGVRNYPTLDNSGKTFYRFSFPKWYQELRADKSIFGTEKTQKETLVPFVFRKLGAGIEEAGTDIAENLLYKNTEWFAKTKNPLYEYSTPSKVIGKTASIGSQIGFLSVVPASAPVLFLGGTTEALLRSKTPKDFIQFAKEEPIELGLATGFGLVKSIKFMKAPLITKGKIPKPKYESREITKPFITPKGAVIYRSKFKLIRSIKPRTAQVTTRWNKLLNKPVKVVEISKGAKHVSWTPTYLTSSKGQLLGKNIFSTARLGKNIKTANIFSLQGQQQTITPEIFKSLSKTQKYQIGKLIEARLGYPIPSKLIPKFLPKNLQYSTGILEAKKLLKLKVGKNPYINIFTNGKTITRSQVFSASKRISSNPLFSEYKHVTSLKDITKPFARASGDIPIIKGKSWLLKPSDLRGPTYEIIPSGNYQLYRQVAKQVIKTKPQIQLLSQVQQIATKTIPKFIPKVTMPIIPQSTKLKTALPFIAQTKQIEKINFVSKPKTIKQLTKTTQIPQTKIKLETSQVKVRDRFESVSEVRGKVGQLGILDSRLKQDSILKQVTQLKQASQLKQTQQLKSELKAELKSAQILKNQIKQTQSTMLRQQLKQQLKQQLRQVSLTRTIIRQTPSQPRPITSTPSQPKPIIPHHSRHNIRNLRFK